MICDFCSAPHPQWRFPCRDFQVAHNAMSVSDWVACDECAAAIQADDWEQLARRSLQTHGAQVLLEMGATEREVLDLNGSLHRRFMENRTGDAVEVKPLEGYKPAC